MIAFLTRPAARSTPFAVTAGVLFCLGACSRHLELYDPGDAGVPVVTGPEPPDEIPEVVDSGLDNPDFAACGERPTGACLGTNDFPCEFPRWVNLAAESCQAVVDCRVHGWLGVRLGEDGCVNAIEMTDPSPDFVACLVQEFGVAGCVQCEAMQATRFLGTTSQESCLIRCVNDPDCPSGYYCEGEFCRRELT